MLHYRVPTARRLSALTLACAITACGAARAPEIVPPPARVPLASAPAFTMLTAHRLVPAPASVTTAEGPPFALTATTTIVVPASGEEAARVGAWMATLLRPATGLPFPVSVADGAVPAGAIVLRLGGDASLGAEGYDLTIASDAIRLVAAEPAGLFRGVQTLRQLLPAAIESEQSVAGVPKEWTIPPGRIVDRPRFAYRGAMLDVARHFFTVKEVHQVIDLLALYKLNTLHLHLSDDQGWRIQIDSWPRLATIGGSTQVGGGTGGYYTKADYAEIVRYAADRFITVVPEIDVPAHTNAAIAAYPELGCSRAVPVPSPNAPMPSLYTGIRVGWSAVCHDKEVTYKFIDDVVRELAAMTPGPFIHMGGDEVEVLTREQYAAFIERVQDIVARHGKRMIGWEEIGRAKLRPGTIAQMWHADTLLLAARQGAKLVMSPATRAYLDMKYTPATELGLAWAAHVELQASYDWDPATFYTGLTENDVLGIEAPLWTETVSNISAAQFLLMPRLPALAEVGWTPTSARNWESFRTRIAAHAPRWRLLGVNYYPSPQVAW